MSKMSREDDSILKVSSSWQAPENNAFYLTVRSWHDPCEAHGHVSVLGP
jgi:hypothetical protein